ncbi:MAG: long-chain fatty acid--CoA ligase [Zetaproteobacteria bacterium CG06_land_8_20_14_3_00_59_53]|nr:MAG: long-chain fatty acid--CoA ligase [Zetaproteobacteria bacterium CG2_30_59_37]PIO90722.1 MAG: long-chain fatty acid--CoA ligase [Zetaproteobacteria bacterium CG23_combo_of_CG06-09_8_20_14_all_59_86]PIQ66174.1 MAG: long-chain fatty acid--CoA ligase [Zetaproteobacteria bacterium CG11_big_fil_rev_8_21_14_0_20_59_439]PIU71646.1 MAG: long-chain fatty acid--CoA ligase [Zetaproteobacteria bacterium CG06_land_8_20_14_3_00_59_53]PIU97925.1 MAG: long-chain fatty acid--CoA ligase [Zetaproteobacteri
MQVACLSDLLLHAPQQWAERELLGSRGRHGWEWLGHAETVRRVLRVARWMHSVGIRHGDRVGILGHNSPQWCIADFAILHIGAVTVPAYFTDPPEAVRFVFEDAGCKLILVEPGEQQSKLDASKVPVFCLRGEEGITLHKISSNAMFDIPCDLPAVGRGDLATLIYTSGTTGEPKGVMLTHGNMLSDVAAGLGGIPVYESDTFLSFLPVSHAFERTVGHFLPVACGAGIAYAEDVTTLLRDIPEVRPTVMISVPRLYEKIYAGVQDKLMHAPRIKQKLFASAQQLGLKRFESRLEGDDLHGMDAFRFRILDHLVHARIRAKMGGRLRLFVSGGAALHPDIARFLLAAGLPVCPGYGLSETSPVLTVNPERRIKPETVGPALPGVQLRLADDGELLARGEMVMQGYWHRPEETSAVLEADGWLHTGDIAEMDSEGYVRIVDRKKELLVLSNGEKVPPARVEKRLAIDPVILQVMVIGDQRPYLTALVVADEGGLGRHWQKEKGRELPSDWRQNKAVKGWLLERMHAACDVLPSYMQVRNFVFVDSEWTQASGMLTPTLKFKRRSIMQRHQADIDAVYAAGEKA